MSKPASIVAVIAIAAVVVLGIVFHVLGAILKPLVLVVVVFAVVVGLRNARLKRRRG